MSLCTNSIHLRVKGQLVVDDCLEIFALVDSLNSLSMNGSRKSRVRLLSEVR